MKRKSLILVTVLLLQFQASGQSLTLDCKSPHSTPPAGPYVWPPDAEVKVYFMRNMFTAEQQRALSRAMEFWSQAAKRNGAGVSLLYAGETDNRRNCDSCLTITRREVNKFDRKHYAFFVPLEMRSDGLLRSAWVDFDFATTDPKALQGFMAHELGHGMGLGDCLSCKRKQTIMTRFPGINKDNGLIEPSPCDLDVVRQVFEIQRHVANSRNQTAAIRVD